MYLYQTSEPEGGTPSTDLLSSQDRLRKEFYGSVPKAPRVQGWWVMDGIWAKKSDFPGGGMMFQVDGNWEYWSNNH